MNKHVIVRTAAAASAIALLTSLAACGDNIPAGTAATANADGLSGNFAGAGASSQQSATEAWIAGFTASNTKAKISYNPSGSGAGVTTFLTGATAWAASDKALSDSEVEQSKDVCASGTAFDVPVYIAPIAVVFNLNGVSDAGKHVNMDAATIAKIFDGKITKWNDPSIQEQNPDITLPDTAITVVHRSDKSGTTQNFVEYLKAAAPDDWTYDLSENWPNEVGQGAKGTSGVISTISQADGTIGYADFSQVGELGTVSVKVGDEYVDISTQAASNAIADSTIDENVTGDNRVVVDVNHTTTADNAYPIVMVSYDIVCPVYQDSATTEFARDWLTYVVSTAGQSVASSATGSAPLPNNIVDRINESIAAMG
ncbi:phosphate ABC transporter substrate-binding protein PstS [Bifidobacterium choloepi]|uniref:Phosphate-binding protein n=1 Tax=Bifidobacterium choloepi TaxID=2614131 RepID=A0A6I5NLP4_9BIFI|nr:phosphate ABC transporter substrate-binding protein PstS [Bifidobacterium choloepi]NEG69692.1 phosphate ABC transporter substrate-binding protein PstS [Bifidobacterium choloepi]